MPPRLLLRPALRALPLRGSTQHINGRIPFRPLPRRPYATDSDKAPPPPPGTQKTGPNQDVLPHVSEEAAMTGKITGEGGPEVEQGTPIHEVLQRDKDGQKKAPEVIKEEIPSAKAPKGSRSYSTVATRETTIPEGFKFEPPELPMPSNAHIKYRYDPLVKQVTALLMRDGKLSVAQRNMTIVLSHLQTAPPPKYSPDRPLLPGAPPAAHLPLHPILYLTLAIDSVAPIMRIRSQRGAAGGGVALQIPVALRQRQRRRKAVEWILDAVNKKQSRGSGRGQFAQRFAEEIISIVEGRSSIWDKRNGVHKLGVSARVNLNYRPRK
ncbi:MAG: hypothetical protein M4579_000855 [Chaenotheca gracillima]|nr:MAG: hypothetical protein M4579_000855 [Chaenotheca gracillima]